MRGYKKTVRFYQACRGWKSKEITSQSARMVEQDLKWNEEINQYDSADIKAFSELVYYQIN